jgi:ferredoxin
MQLVVDMNQCQGYAQCAFHAPDTFTIRGDEVLVYDPAPDQDQTAEVLRASAACPVKAILVTARTDMVPAQRGHRQEDQP